MDTYSILREIADSWVLLLLVLFFAGAVIWAVRPGSSQRDKEAGSIIFRNEARPAVDTKKKEARS